ncbi:MAG: hypothetical protein AB8B50_13620 [Pirellulaceae bacterium]
MICDALKKEEMYEAYALYSSLHGFEQSLDEIRTVVNAYYDGVTPNALIDEAMIAYMDDAVVAPPGIVIPAWGSSRFYELIVAPDETFRRKVCEAWFANDCQLPTDTEIPLVHFWTNVTLAQEQSSSDIADGQRLSLKVGSNETAVGVCHRELGDLGILSPALSRKLASPAMLPRKFIGFVDRPTADEEKALSSRPSESQLRIFVASSAGGIATNELLDYAVRAHAAVRLKC